ncbi:hypothetical protein NL676_006595, partial [Syzygium grande]
MRENERPPTQIESRGSGAILSPPTTPFFARARAPSDRFPGVADLVRRLAGSHLTMVKDPRGRGAAYPARSTAGLDLGEAERPSPKSSSRSPRSGEAELTQGRRSSLPSPNLGDREPPAMARPKLTPITAAFKSRKERDEGDLRTIGWSRTSGPGFLS